MSLQFPQPTGFQQYQQSGSLCGQPAQPDVQEVNREPDDLKPEMDSLAMGLPDIIFPNLDFPSVSVVGIV